MGTFNATLFMLETLAVVVFFAAMQHNGSTPVAKSSLKDNARAVEKRELKKAA